VVNAPYTALPQGGSESHRDGVPHFPLVPQLYYLIIFSSTILDRRRDQKDTVATLSYVYILVYVKDLLYEFSPSYRVGTEVTVHEEVVFGYRTRDSCSLAFAAINRQSFISFGSQDHVISALIATDSSLHVLCNHGEEYSSTMPPSGGKEVKGRQRVMEAKESAATLLFLEFSYKVSLRG
jgi:hypothetical protein